MWDSPAFLKQFCMVGDNLDSDILFGKNAGIGTILVLSGLTQIDTHEEKIMEINPDFIMTRFSL